MYDLFYSILLKTASYIVKVYAWVVLSTSETIVRIDPKSAELLAKQTTLLPCLWHNRIFLIPSFMRKFGSFSAVISTHKDGDFLSEILKLYNHSSIRGSSRRGGFAAIKGVMNHLKSGKSVFITPDGPLGPRYNINGNVTNIAYKSDTPILPICYSAKNAKILKTWDRFIIPLPFNKIIIEISQPLLFSKTSSEDERKNLLQRAMMNQSDKLDREVETNNKSLNIIPKTVFGIYRICSTVAHYFLKPYLKFRSKKNKETTSSIAQKLGTASETRPLGKLIWVHGASVGESKSIMPIVEILSKKHNFNVLITTSTVTGSEFVKEKISSNTKLLQQFLILDTPQNTKSFFNHWKPDLAILIDSEIWPNILYGAKFPILLLNGRISPKSFYYWNIIPGIFKLVTKNMCLISPTTKQDEDFFKILGVEDKIVKLGNLKSAAPPMQYDVDEYKKLKNILQGFNFVCASTHDDEEANILQYFKDSEMTIIIVPRHIARTKEIADYATNIGYEVILRSKNPTPNFKSKKPRLYLVDKFGELGLWYKIADISFIGGSFACIGGHNLIEAAQLGSPIIVGPQTYNFSDIVAQLKEANALLQVNTFEELRDTVNGLSKARLSELSKNSKKATNDTNNIINDHIEHILSMLDKDR